MALVMLKNQMYSSHFAQIFFLKLGQVRALLLDATGDILLSQNQDFSYFAIFLLLELQLYLSKFF